MITRKGPFNANAILIKEIYEKMIQLSSNILYVFLNSDKITNVTMETIFDIEEENHRFAHVVNSAEMCPCGKQHGNVPMW